MSSLSDEALARILQAEFDEEYQAEGHAKDSSNTDGHSSNFSQVVPHLSVPSGSSQSTNSKPLSLIDKQWELLDPTPDPRALFLQFNDRFFWGKLSGVEVRWSPRMTLCAGVCSYEGRGGLCSIRLSVPLLKLRPRKDLVETLLHEMIHAFLFVTQNNRDRDGHGPEFCKHKDRINKASGTKITIYHSFHDEVDNYRQHWWRCNGPCQQRKPFFGYVKRAMNRAPSRNDIWWAEHQLTCGGTFTKIKEPEGYNNKKRKKDGDPKGDRETETRDKKPKRENHDIRDFIPFGGAGHRLGGSDSKRIKEDIKSGTTQRQDGTSWQMESKDPQLENGVPRESSEKANGKTLMRDKANVATSPSWNDVNQRPSENHHKTNSKKLSNNLHKVNDVERRKKKLEELKAIFVSSSEDEDDIAAVCQGKGKKMKTKTDMRTSSTDEDGEVRRGKSEEGGSNLKNKIRCEDRQPQDGRETAGTSTTPSSIVPAHTMIPCGGANRGSPGRGPREGNHSSGQSSLHEVVERMKRPSGETVGSSQDHVEENDHQRYGNESQTVCCPVCGSEVLQSQINTHLDSCLSG